MIVVKVVAVVSLSLWVTSIHSVKCTSDDLPSCVDNQRRISEQHIELVGCRCPPFQRFEQTCTNIRYILLRLAPLARLVSGRIISSSYRHPHLKELTPVFIELPECLGGARDR